MNYSPAPRDLQSSDVLPATAPIVAACRRATVRNYGSTIVGRPLITADPVRVRMSSYPRRNEALYALDALGYAVRPESDHGCTLHVTGWDIRLLTLRAEYLERAVIGLRHAHYEYACCAVNRYDWLLDVDGIDEETAANRVLEDSRRNVAEHLGRVELQRTWPVSDEDLERAEGPVRELLQRIAAACAELAGARELIDRLVTSVVARFLAYRTDGADYELAATNAISEALAEVAPPTPTTSCGAVVTR